MSWRVLTAADVQTQLSGDELEKLQTLSLVNGQADPLPGIITQVSDEVRGYIRANSANKMDASAKLPPEVIGAAIVIARWRLCGRLAIGGSAQLLMTPQREKDYSDAIEFLKAVAKGEIAVEQPADEITEEAERPLGCHGSATKVSFKSYSE
jgi:phage gp36-like protein